MVTNRPNTREEQRNAFTSEAFVKSLGEAGEHLNCSVGL